MPEFYNLMHIPSESHDSHLWNGNDVKLSFQSRDWRKWDYVCRTFVTSSEPPVNGQAQGSVLLATLCGISNSLSSARLEIKAVSWVSSMGEVGGICHSRDSPVNQCSPHCFDSWILRALPSSFHVPLVCCWLSKDFGLVEFTQVNTTHISALRPFLPLWVSIFCFTCSQSSFHLKFVVSLGSERRWLGPEVEEKTLTIFFVSDLWPLGIFPGPENPFSWTLLQIPVFDWLLVLCGACLPLCYLFSVLPCQLTLYISKYV